MGQFKKTEVRDAILSSAKALFTEHGYFDTSLSRIAAGAGTSTANVYVYFKSKVEILYEIYDPWLRARIERLAIESQDIADPLERLKHVLRTFWRDIPREEGGFGNNIIQAISTGGAAEGYRPTLLTWMEERMGELVRSCMSPTQRELFKNAQLGHFLVMAFDGYIVYHHLEPGRPLDEKTLDPLCRMFLGGDRLVAAPASAEAKKVVITRVRRSA